MEYRKLISFGKSSFVVSLPKSWLKQNKLKKGDLIYLEENSTNLVLQPKISDSETEEKEIILSVDGKDIRRIQRELISAYIQNYKTITLVGEEIKTKAKEIQKFIQGLVALEVMEHDARKIVTKDFLNLNDISLDQITKKIDVITRSMLKDCKNMFKEDNYEYIYLRDNDVNKFRFLVYRIVWYALEKPSLLFKKLHLHQRDLFNYWWMSFTLELIADYTKRIARYMNKINLSSKEQQEFTKLLDKTELMYLEIMKAYYTNNSEIAHKVVQDRFNILQTCDLFYQRNIDTPFIGFLTYNLKSLIVAIHTVGRIVYQGMPG